jgi:dolichyl-phosphate beta-glucosyltransferase
MLTSSTILTVIGDTLQLIPTWILLLAPVILSIFAYIALYTILVTFAPTPREATASEKTCVVAQFDPDGVVNDNDAVKLLMEKLPCWYDSWKTSGKLEPNKVALSVVIPAYNEEQRLIKMLDEAVEYLGPLKIQYEILLVSDGSTDDTVDVATDWAEANWDVPLKIIKLQTNRGKGGAVTHGLRHVIGERILFVDADGATTFSDLKKLNEALDKLVQLGDGRGIAIGSRAHLVGSEAVVKVCSLPTSYVSRKLTYPSDPC